MARSPLTLAAAATSALPRVRIVEAGSLTAGGPGRCDAAVLTLDDGSRVVVRAPVDESAARRLAAESLALRALTPGVRELLGARAPELLGEAPFGDGRAVVTDLLPGYHVDAAHLPSGPGAAPSVGRTLAAVHALPVSIVRAEGLSVRTPDEVRTETRDLVDRSIATGRLPRELAARWREAVVSDGVWRFESTVILGGADAGSFLFEDTDAGPAVTGMVDWHALSVGDPAADLRWLASAPDAADDVFEAYQAASHRAPDPFLRARSRLYAELEFAKWLLHGVEQRSDEVVADAIGLLTSLAEGVHTDDLLAVDGAETLDVHDALAFLERSSPPSQPAADTSMQTDAYDPDQLALFVPDESGASDDSVAGRPAVDAFAEDAAVADARAAASSAAGAFDDVSTAPIDIVTWADARTIAAHDDGQADPEADAAEAERASRDALRRWAASE